MALGLVLTILFYLGRLRSSTAAPLGPRTSRGREAAGNSTLGFGTIFFINMPTRYDRLDAASLQAYLSGIDITVAAGVSPDMVNDVGMPPTHAPSALSHGQKGCWRAHANIWSRMLRENTRAALIVEADASWDANLREIMMNLSGNLTQFLRHIEAQRLPKPKLRSRLHHQPADADADAALYADKDKEDDPWHSDYWDVLSLGHCSEETLNSNITWIYDDAHVAPGMEYFGRSLGRERVIRKAGHQGCTTAYAVSLHGAAKLLLRSAADLDQAVDMGMSSLVQSGHLTSYSVYPPVLAQWVYVDGIGMDQRGSNSDMGGTAGFSIGADSDPNEVDWTDARRTGSVWTPKKFPSNAAFEDMALESAWRQIFGDADPFAGMTAAYTF
ncbi:LPS glycosyltransferase [Metarhizium album ARSEF 1941]|uniref:LPS glycosyltransferase n=1 Tax=Metarhizium album (strain ARSEF 1941) TaxID=1081103 RepID=A0A0B2WKS8_METAS|nr:LPS glycosyltransferase [Metarhizium album ARSEF 1941]KHN94097.1 LPS glycosyltransferase [Metarhizium album ARSEF 1941]